MSGFDWVLIDLDHGSGSEVCVPDQQRALRGTKTRGIVLVGAPHADLIARFLNWSAQGIMIAHGGSAAAGTEAVACDGAGGLAEASKEPPQEVLAYFQSLSAERRG